MSQAHAGPTIGTTVMPEPCGSPDGQVFLSARGISKRFHAVQALDDASLEIRPSTVHALVGANGAGKSTMINILAGLTPHDQGRIEVDGEEVTAISHPRVASSLGFGFIHQELDLVPRFTVLENLMLGHVDSRWGLTRKGEARRRARTALDRLGADIRLTTQVDQLTINERWMVALASSLMEDSRLVVMDEPTASFTDAEAERLFRVIRDLKDGGVAILYVSHRLDEVLEISDEVTVFRNGRVEATGPTAFLDRSRLTELIAGRRLRDITRAPATASTSGEPVLEVKDVRRPRAVRGANIEVHAGEILGIAGLVGSGRTEFARIVAGLDIPNSGEMRFCGRKYAPKSSYEAVRCGVAFVPEERRSQALILGESVSFNLNMSARRQNRAHPRLPFLSTAKGRRAAGEMIDRFNIKTPSPATLVGNLSGGNQQKVVLGKCMQTGPRLLILDEPTVGVDVGAREEIYQYITELAANGTGVVLISSDFEELVLAHRVVIMRRGRFTHSVSGADVSKDHLTHLCYEDEESSS